MCWKLTSDKDDSPFIILEDINSVLIEWATSFEQTYGPEWYVENTFEN